MSYQFYAFLWSAVLLIFLEPLTLIWFKRRKLGQEIREDGPQSHIEAKSGTPTMGGIMMIVVVSIIAIVKTTMSGAITAALITFIGFGLVGFLDDYIKVVKKRNLGLTEVQKMVGQIIFAIFIAIYGAKISPFGTNLYIPFAGKYVDFGLFYYPFVVFAVIAVVNGANLTDGLDGLNTSVTSVIMVGFITTIAFGGVAYKFIEDLNIFMYSVTGVCVGFLYFNRHPAKMFMGDVGSLALGGAVSAIAVLSGYVLLLPIIGIVYVLEVLSDIIQVFHFKRTGKRVFRMAPLHHHFELGGWSENRVVFVFSLISIVGAIIGVVSVM